ncbi:MAG: site-2 protease family protein [bacterium]|nr:site-2 protease family protein [bacterium]
MTTLLVIAILVLLIVAHELGHFIVAKIFKIRVDEFGIGYPPRAFLLGKIGETEYSLNWIPFGGFVRIYGEDEQLGQRSFSDAKRWKQALVLFAGVAANTVVAYTLFATAFTQGVPRIVDSPSVGEHVQLLISDVVSGSPADVGGLIAGDELVSVETMDGNKPTELSPSGVTDFVRARGGESITIIYMRAQATSTVSMRPANAVVPGEAGRPALGIGLVAVSTKSLSIGEAFSTAFTTTTNAFMYVGESLWTILWNSVHGAPDLSQVVGPVGLVGVIGDATHSGAGYVLALAGFISVNLAIINLIPIPALDGGRLVVLGVEALTRRKASHLVIQCINTIGIALIILLMVVVTYNDIARLLM